MGSGGGVIEMDCIYLDKLRFCHHAICPVKICENVLMELCVYREEY